MIVKNLFIKLENFIYLQMLKYFKILVQLFQSQILFPLYLDIIIHILISSVTTY